MGLLPGLWVPLAFVACKEEGQREPHLSSGVFILGRDNTAEGAVDARKKEGEPWPRPAAALVSPPLSSEDDVACARRGVLDASGGSGYLCTTRVDGPGSLRSLLE